MSAPARSLLFVPASRPDRFEKALAAGADAVIVDLEDAVAPADKDKARASLAAWLKPGHEVIVRLNGADTQWFADDLALCAQPGVAAIMLPKAERVADLAALSRAGASALLPLIESAAGFAALTDLAAAPGVQRLVFGSIDFQVDLGMRDAREDELLFFRSQLVLASRLAGLQPPVDGVSTAIDDDERLRDDVLRARRLGFGGKLCIHPRQVAAVQRHLGPDATELAWAQRVLAAAAQAGGAAIAVDGKMVDKPVILRAEAILREAPNGPRAALEAFWDARYAESGFAYGTEANDFLVAQLERLPRHLPVLCLADGEGRNGVWLARQGFAVTSVDVAGRGLAKARELARARGVEIETVQADLTRFELGSGRWGAIVSIFLHLPAKPRRALHARCVQALAPGGVFIHEGYGEQQLRYATGGPKEPSLLPRLDELLAELDGCVIEHRFSGVRNVVEGRLHHGESHVNQIVARKPA